MSAKPEDWWAAASAGGSTATLPRAARSCTPSNAAVTLDPLLAGLRVSSAAVATPSATLAEPKPAASQGHARAKSIAPHVGPRAHAPHSPRAAPAPPAHRALSGRLRPPSVSRTDLRELVEHATGLGRSHSDVPARDTALRWVREGKADPTDLFRAVVAGPGGTTDAPLNLRVLTFVHWVTVLGGPHALAAACEPAGPRRPSPAMRVCMDVLKACGHTSYSPSVVEDAADRVRSWTTDHHPPLFDPHAPIALPAPVDNPDDTSLKIALEMYAILLGRKLSFHAQYPEVEANYSLDRFYRQFHIENEVDSMRAAANTRRHAAVLSVAMGAELALLASGAAATAAALDRARAPLDIVGLVFTDAVNAYALAEYVLAKATPAPGQDIGPPLPPVREWLAKRTKAMEVKNGDAIRVVQRFVEPTVLRAVAQPVHKPVRPESRHRREVPCCFSSFAGMHAALAPSIQPL
jgi:hypothetical protein